MGRASKRRKSEGFGQPALALTSEEKARWFQRISQMSRAQQWDMLLLLQEAKCHDANGVAVLTVTLGISGVGWEPFCNFADCPNIMVYFSKKLTNVVGKRLKDYRFTAIEVDGKINVDLWEMPEIDYVMTTLGKFLD